MRSGRVVTKFHSLSGRQRKRKLPRRWKEMLLNNTVEISVELYREMLKCQSVIGYLGGVESASAMLPPKEKNEFLKFQGEINEGEHDPTKVDY
ncbi:hypothetical protein PVS_34 [Vibrio phage vB_VspS_VS-ABTNL-3]|nr:hypothetical protein PVS_34 [Vibrio phage vB_VspS_VS-ABTNL-3]